MQKLASKMLKIEGLQGSELKQMEDEQKLRFCSYFPGKLRWQRIFSKWIRLKIYFLLKTAITIAM